MFTIILFFFRFSVFLEDFFCKNLVFPSKNDENLWQMRLQQFWRVRRWAFDQWWCLGIKTLAPRPPQTYSKINFFCFSLQKLRKISENLILQQFLGVSCWSIDLRASPQANNPSPDPIKLFAKSFSLDFLKKIGKKAKKCFKKRKFDFAEIFKGSSGKFLTCGEALGLELHHVSLRKSLQSQFSAFWCVFWVFSAKNCSKSLEIWLCSLRWVTCWNFNPKASPHVNSLSPKPPENCKIKFSLFRSFFVNSSPKFA